MAAKLARSQGVSYQELLSQDVVAPPTTLTLENPYEGASTRVPVSRYATQEFHDLEMEKLWPKVWQAACRVEEIPEVGSYTIYEIGTFSILVVRTNEGIRAHHNVCRHRGRRLCDHAGHAPSFICPFHGFTWNLDGTLRGVTSDWDFPHVDKDGLVLTPVQCDTWGGWVFINMDMDAGPLAEHLGVLPEHFAVWEPENRYIEAHVAKVMGCNWKACQEAFMEAFHVVKTHPQILVGIGDENSQYDVWGNLSRAITPNGTPSPHLSFGPDEQELFDSVTMRFMDRPAAAEVPEGTTARAMMAAGARMGIHQIVGEDKDLSDASLSDSIYYTLFPNFHPWGGYNRIVYRFRPYDNRYDKSIMECYYITPFSGDRPDPAPVHWLAEDEDWTEAPELGILAKVFQQDSFNLPNVQIGLAAAQYEEIVLANYQETKIRHFHDLLSTWIGE